MPNDDLHDVYERLRELIEDETEHLDVIHDTDNHYEVRLGRRMFGEVALRKTGVRFHLRELVRHPEWVEALSEGLRRHFHGPTDFTFKSLTPEQARELATLTRLAFEALMDAHRADGTDRGDRSR